MNKNKFKERMSHRRKELGLTQRALAFKAGLTPAAINQLEKGLRSPQLKSLIKICKSLNISSDYLLGIN